MQAPHGIWIPLVTPFLDGALDLESFERLVRHYVETGAHGLVVLGTTGESPTVDDEERDLLLDRAIAAAAGRIPVVLGLGGNDTRHLVKTIATIGRPGLDGLLSVCPYYSRPGQYGLVEHYRCVAAASSLPVLVYNVPYRTGVNLANDVLIELGRLPGIIGVKDASGSATQSLALLAARPRDLAVLTGEDALLYTMLANGADGGILASAHLATSSFLEVYARLRANDHHGALRVWRTLEPLVHQLFVEPNPMPLKHCLWRLGLIRSPECRLPLTSVSPGLAGSGLVSNQTACLRAHDGMRHA